MKPEQFNRWTSFLSDGMLLLSRSGEVLATNPAVADLGIHRARLLGKRLQSHAKRRNGSVDDFLKDCSRVSSAIGTRMSFSRDGEEAQELYCEALMDRWSGAEHPVFLLKLKDTAKSPVQNFVALTEQIEELNREISRRKQLELEQNELTSKLAELNRRKDLFLTDLSAEMSELLDLLSTALEKLPAGTQESVPDRALIANQMQHLRALTDDLLTVSRLNRKDLHLEFAPVELNALLRFISAANAERFQRREIELRLTESRGVLVVHGDEARLRQLLRNLLDNALQASSSGHEVEISLRRSKTGRAQIAVRDSGQTRTDSELEKLFEPFSYHNSVSAGQPLGVGLTLARQLAELHGGSVEAIGEGNGNTFLVSLPLIREGRSADARDSAPSPA